jgi:hypothetical protein
MFSVLFCFPFSPIEGKVKKEIESKVKETQWNEKLKNQ